MTKQSKKNKNPIVTVCAVVVAVILLVVVAVLLFANNKKLDDNFFTNDGTKYVLTLDSNDMLGLDLGEYAPEKTHLVYFYSGDKVTDLKYYYEYMDKATAKDAAVYLKEANPDFASYISVNDKYVIITADKMTYEEMTAEDAQQQIEFIEMLQDINTNKTTNESETKEEETETEEDTAEEETVEEDLEEVTE